MIAGLPYDAEIEYLESTGTQYIDTGVESFTNESPDAEKTITYTGTVARLTNSGYCLHTNTFTSSAWWGTNGDKWRLGDNNSATTFTTGKMYNVHVYTTGRTDDKSWMSVDGTEVLRTTRYSSRNTAASIYLFAARTSASGSSAFGGSWRIAHLRIYVGTTLVRDLIPVRVGQTGYMYDRVSRKLFGNKGTGAFNLGPDVATPVMGLRGMLGGLSPARYVRSGLVAMWDGIDNAGLGVHDDKTDTWVDIVGGMNLSKRGNGTIKVKPMCMSFNGTYCFYASKSLGSICTMETVVDAKTQIGSADPVLVQLNGTSEYKVHVNANQLTLGISYVGSMGQRFGYINTGVKAVSWVFEKSPQLGYLFGTQIGTWNQNKPQTATSIGIGAANSSMFRPGVGDIYCVRLYNRALTDAEIAHNYSIDKARFNLP